MASGSAAARLPGEDGSGCHFRMDHSSHPVNASPFRPGWLAFGVAGFPQALQSGDRTSLTVSSMRFAEECGGYIYIRGRFRSQTLPGFEPCMFFVSFLGDSISPDPGTQFYTICIKCVSHTDALSISEFSGSER